MTAIHPDAGVVIHTGGNGSKACKPCSRGNGDHAGSRTYRKSSASGFDLEVFKAARHRDGEPKPPIASPGEPDDAKEIADHSGSSGPDAGLQNLPPEGLLHRLQLAIPSSTVEVVHCIPLPNEEPSADVEQEPSADGRYAEGRMRSALPQLAAIAPREPDGLRTEATARGPVDRLLLSLPAGSREESMVDCAGRLAERPEFSVGQAGAAHGEQPAAVTGTPVGSASVLAGEQTVAPPPTHIRQAVGDESRPVLRWEPMAALPHRTSPDLASLRVTLSPSDLGTVDLVIRRRGSKLEIRLITETDGAALAIAGGRTSLDAALASQGVGMTVANVEVVSRAVAPAHEQSPADAMLRPESGQAGGHDRQKSHEGSGSAVGRRPAPESRPRQVGNGAEQDAGVLQERGRTSLGSWRIV